MRRPPRIVAKLGGSLAPDASLAQWLRSLAQEGSARFVVVPGGGPFADAVRTAQQRWHFSEGAAHGMAIAAMEQFGRMLCAIESGAIACSTLDQIEQAWSIGRLPVWMPVRLMEQEQELERTWDVTSDTIAAWLANLLGADGLLLIKSCELPDDQRDPAVLAAAGVIDTALPVYLLRTSLPWELAHKDQWRTLPQLVTRMKSRISREKTHS